MTGALQPAPAEGGTLALFRRFPQLRDRLPRAPLTVLPTRVHRLEHLGHEIGIEQLWIKRDDETGKLYGGNKPRKLEFALGAAIAHHRRAVLTFGGIGTHHGLATAVCARSLGLRCILMLLRQPVTAHVRHCLLMYFAAGAELHYAPGVPGLSVQTLRVLAREVLRGDVPYIVPAGGSSPLGTLGYVNAALELREQVAAGTMPEPDWIFVPLGSGGTVAGLALGAKLAGLRARVVGVLVTDILPPSQTRLMRLAHRSLKLLCQRCPDIPRISLSVEDFPIVREYVGPSYGAPTQAGRAARDRMGRLEGIALETSYTAKCLAALIDATRAPQYQSSCILFWNTYSSVDPASHLGALPDYSRLPRVFHQFFTGPTVAT